MSDPACRYSRCTVCNSAGSRRAASAVHKGRGEIYVVDAGSPPGPESLGESKVSLADMVIDLDPREEWEQIYFEGWRHMRDFYWDKGMGGVDWKALRDQYLGSYPQGVHVSLVARQCGSE